MNYLWKIYGRERQIFRETYAVRSLFRVRKTPVLSLDVSWVSETFPEDLGGLHMRFICFSYVFHKFMKYFEKMYETTMNLYGLLGQPLKNSGKPLGLLVLSKFSAVVPASFHYFLRVWGEQNLEVSWVSTNFPEDLGGFHRCFIRVSNVFSYVFRKFMNYVCKNVKHMKTLWICTAF